MLFAIVGELVHVMYYVIFATGCLAWLVLPAFFIGAFIFAGSGESMINDGPYGPIDATELESSFADKPVAAILEQCLTHRASLKYYHRVLCERAGVEPDSLCPMADLIGEAVFDGRNQNRCIYEVDMSTQEKEINQHA
jgi:hypothetical protein